MSETSYHMEKTIFGESLRCRKEVSRRSGVLERRITGMSGSSQELPYHEFMHKTADGVMDRDKY